MVRRTPRIDQVGLRFGPSLLAVTPRAEPGASRGGLSVFRGRRALPAPVRAGGERTDRGGPPLPACAPWRNLPTAKADPLISGSREPLW